MGHETESRTSIKNAAKTLGVTEKSIQRYLAKGLLTRIKEGKRTYLLSSEVMSLVDNRAEGHGRTVSGHNVSALRAQGFDIVTLDRERFEKLLIELGELRKQNEIMLEYKSAIREKELLLRDMERELEQAQARLRAIEKKDTEKDREISEKSARLMQLEQELELLKSQKPWWQR